VVYLLADIASYQAGINFVRAKAAGVQIVNIKTSEGTGYTFENFTNDGKHYQDAVYYAQAAQQQGFGISSFHFLTNAGSGADQADLAWSMIEKMGGPEVVHAHQIDCESNATWQIWLDYLNRMNQHFGRPACYNYSPRYWWGPRGWAGASHTPWLMSPPNLYSQSYGSYYPGVKPTGAADAMWQANYGGWGRFAAVQYAVAALASPQGPVGGGQLSLTVFDEAAWAAVSGGADMSGVTADNFAIALSQGSAAFKTEQGTQLSVEPVKWKLAADAERAGLKAQLTAVTSQVTALGTQLAGLQALLQTVLSGTGTGTPIDQAALMAKLNEMAAADTATATSLLAEIDQLQAELAAYRHAEAAGAAANAAALAETAGAGA
jgi:hypothetical protein